MFCLSQRERQREGEAEGEERRGGKSELAHMTVVLTEARRGRLLSRNWSSRQLPSTWYECWEQNSGPLGE